MTGLFISQKGRKRDTFGFAMKTSIVLLVAGSIICTAQSPPITVMKTPRVFLLDAIMLEKLKDQSQSKDTLQLLSELKRAAEKAKSEGPFSVMLKEQFPPSKDKHDYMSQAPYFWPDPSKPHGLPYMRKDGERNPEINKITDHDQMSHMSTAVRTLGLAYYFIGDESYAQSAATTIRTWFLDLATKMNPNLEYGQGIPGVNNGRSIGIIESRVLVDVVDAIGLIAGSKAWSEADQKGMVQWFDQYLNWLQHSDNGHGEEKAKNNHGTYYDVQVAGFALFVGKLDLAHKVLLESETKRLAEQVKPDGEQPLELDRTKAFSYSLMNLRGLMELAALGQTADVDIWNFQTKDGRSIQKAVDYLLPYATKEKEWSRQQITEINPQEFTSIALLAAIHYHDPKYLAAVEKIGMKSSDIDSNILHAVVIQ